MDLQLVVVAGNAATRAVDIASLLVARATQTTFVPNVAPMSVLMDRLVATSRAELVLLPVAAALALLVLSAELPFVDRDLSVATSRVELARNLEVLAS